MRPQLHPEMGQTVLCARVARQLVALHYRKHIDTAFCPATVAAFAAWSLPPTYPGMLRFALHSLGVYLDLGMTSAAWLSNVLEASHLGHNFRRCFFFDYKVNRGPYPRVTNRGVQTSPQAPDVRVRKGRHSA